jgi:DNA-binding NtrC family response regulator
LSLDYESVAIVDDEKDIVSLFTELLQESGYRAKGFTNPLSFLEYFRQYPNEFNMIILDYRMSPMQGCELAKETAKINPQIKMVLVTAYDGIVNNSLHLEIVRKPLTINQILELVKRYINLKTC